MRELFTKEPRTFWVVVGVVLAQLLLAKWAVTAEWYWFLLVAYWVGGTLNHSMQMAVCVSLWVAPPFVVARRNVSC